MTKTARIVMCQATGPQPMMGVDANNTPVVFLHIPKTAGTTLRWVLGQVYESFETLLADDHPPYPGIPNSVSPDQRTPSTRLVYGHWPEPYLFSDMGAARVFTFLRDPLSRFFSHYHYALREPTDPDHERVQTMAIEDYLLASRWMDNFQARKLRFHPFRKPVPALAGREAYDEAFENLRMMDFVGLVERFDESLVMMKRRFGWSQIPVYRRLNKTESYAPRVRKEFWRDAERYLSVDQELYEIAQARLNLQILEEGPDFREELREFRYRLVQEQQGDLVSA